MNKSEFTTDNKLLSILNLLDGVQKRECGNYLRSPYFNQREDVDGLWRYLLGNRKKTPDRREAWDAACPGEPFDESRWRHLQTFLVARIEDFLALRRLEQAPLLHDLELARYYHGRQADKPRRHVLQRLEKRLAGLPRDHEFYHWEYRVEWEKYVANEPQTRSWTHNLPAVGRALDIYLLSSKLRLACLMESHRTVSNTAIDNSLLPVLLAFLEQDPLRETPAIALYYYCYRALTVGREDDFRAFRHQLETLSDQLPDDERRTFLLAALNYCIRRLNTGETRYIREAFDLYRVGLDTGALLENGHLSRFAYKNIVALGLRLEEFQWVHDFIYRYEDALEEKFRSANRDYNLARLHFTQKDYKKAMPLLARVDESDLFLNIDSRLMLLKMYYETGEWDALDALVASFKILLLRKKKLIGYHYSYYQNTLRYIHKLTRLQLQDKKAVAAFREEVARHEALNEKDWLYGQLPVP